MDDLLIALGLTALIFGVGLAGVDAMHYRSCGIYEEETGIKTKYRNLDTCYIQTATGWMRYDEFKARATTREQTK